jgi:hypothetical protein
MCPARAAFLTLLPYLPMWESLHSIDVQVVHFQVNSSFVVALVGLVLVIAIALMYTLFSSLSANSCFAKLCRGISWLVVVAITVAVPAVMVPILAIGAFVWMIILAFQKRKENDLEERRTGLVKDLNLMKAFLEAPIVPPGEANLQAALVSATSKPQRIMPRTRATTVMPGATTASEFWATYVRDQNGSRYVILEPSTNQFIVLTSAQFVQDWVPWMAPIIAHAPAHSTPQWQSTNQ